MFCRFCGESIPDDSDFCPCCGSKLTENDSDIKATTNPMNVSLDESNCNPPCQESEAKADAASAQSGGNGVTAQIDKAYDQIKADCAKKDISCPSISNDKKDDVITSNHEPSSSSLVAGNNSLGESSSYDSVDSLDFSQNRSASPQKAEEGNVAKRNKKTKTALVVFLILTLLFAGVALWQTLSGFSLRDRIAELNSALAAETEMYNSANSKNEVLKKDKETLKRDKEKLSKYLDTASIIFSVLSKYEPSTPYNDFFSDTDIMILKEGESKTAQITCYWYTTIYNKANNDNSSAEWGDFSNSIAPIRITAHNAGTTTYEFTNDYNDHTFKILVIVIPSVPTISLT